MLQILAGPGFTLLMLFRLGQWLQSLWQGFSVAAPLTRQELGVEAGPEHEVDVFVRFALHEHLGLNLSQALERQLWLLFLGVALEIHLERAHVADARVARVVLEEAQCRAALQDQPE